MKLNLAYIFLSMVMSSTVMAEKQLFTPDISTIQGVAKAAVAKKISPPTGAQVVITPQVPDNRVNIPRCSSELLAELATDREVSRNNTVKISCESPDFNFPWQMYLSVRVDISFPVVVAKEPLAQGTVLTMDMLQLKYLDQYSVNGEQYTDVNQLLGTRVKRRITKDYPIFGTNVCFVCKGDTVSIIASSEKFQIKTVGEAQEDGNLGQQIRVKNSRSNKVVDAVVTHVGEVRVNM